MDFKMKVVLITGATSGIGEATALYFANLGAKLALTGRNAANLQKTADECAKIANGLTPFSIVGDLAKETDVKNIIGATINNYGRLDVLVNNAGILLTGTLTSCTLPDFDEVMNVNVRSVVLLTKLAMPYLIKTEGNVVNISSVNGLRPSPSRLAYCMSKAALDQFTKCVALEVASKKVRVNAINPGTVVSNLQKRAGICDDTTYSKYVEAAIKLHPLGRVGSPNEVASVIAFLASDLASNITGVTLPVDAGLSISSPK